MDDSQEPKDLLSALSGVGSGIDDAGVEGDGSACGTIARDEEDLTTSTSLERWSHLLLSALNDGIEDERVICRF